MNVGTVPSQKVKAWMEGLGAASSALNNGGFNVLWKILLGNFAQDKHIWQRRSSECDS